MKKKTSLLRAILFYLLLMLSMAGYIQAQTIELNKLAIDNLSETLQLHFGFAPQEFDGFQELLEDGVPLKLSCDISLLQRIAFWPDKLVSEENVCFELEANALTREYILTDLNANRSMQNKKLEPLLRSNLGELSVNLGDWKSLVQGQTYVLELEISLKRNDVPAWLKRALFFWSGDVLKNKKYKMKFTY